MSRTFLGGYRKSAQIPIAQVLHRLLCSQLSGNSYKPATAKEWSSENISTQINNTQITDNRASLSTFLNIDNPLTLKVWQQVLSELSISPKYILILRHPWESAQSMTANHSLDIEKAYILWLAHARAALSQISSQSTESTSSSPINYYQLTDNSLITYDQLLADPVTTLHNSLSSDTINKSQLTNNSPALLDYIHPTLKTHHAGDLPEPDKEIYEPFFRLYDKLRAGQKNLKLDLDHGIIDVLFQTVSHHDIQNIFSPINKSQLTNYKHSQLTNNRYTDNQATQLTTTISLPSQNQQGYITETYPLIEDQWQKIALNVPAPELLRDHSIHFQPLNTNGIVRIAGIRLVNKATGQNVLDLASKEDFDKCTVQESALRLPDEDSLLLMSTGEQAKLDLLVGADFVDCPLEIVFWVKAKRDQSFHFAEFLNQKGEILYNNEQFKEAAECFQQARDLQAGSAWYCQNLAEAIARVNYDSDQVWQNRNLAKSISTNGKKWDTTVRCYRQALKLDPQVVKKHQSTQSFNVDLANEHYVEKPVFIVGCGHSGTSLMLVMLANHPSFHPIPKESALFLRTDKTINRTMAEWDKECADQGKSRWVEKTPPHIFQIHRFLAFRPQSQFVLMLRDGRDVVCSLRFRKGYEQIQDRIGRWVYDNMSGLHYWQHPQVKVVKYEALIATPETVMREICQFLGKDYSSTLFEYYKTEHYWFSDRIVKPEEIKSHQDHNDNRNWQINQPIFDGRGRWKTEMSEDEKQQFKESPAQGYLEQFGYSSDQKW